VRKNSMAPDPIPRNMKDWELEKLRETQVKVLLYFMSLPGYNCSNKTLTHACMCWLCHCPERERKKEACSRNAPSGA
jgi:hypothetical protein